MSNKKLVCFYTEGETDEVFYDNLLKYFRTLTATKRFSVAYVKKQNIKGIGKLEGKLIRKFKSEILPYKKNENCELIIFLCYDKDVFDFNRQPPIDRKKLEKSLISEGADKVIHIVADKSIEDIFLTDEETIIKVLKLKRKDFGNISGNGYERLKKLYKEANRIYYKGEKVEDFVEKLDMQKICCTHCAVFQPICDTMFTNLTCASK